MSRYLHSAAVVFSAALMTIPLALGADSPSAADGLNWYRGNTHTHTLNSDGDSSPEAVVRHYQQKGYQFLFVTDHEFLTDPAPLNALFKESDHFLVLPGQEVTQWSADPKHGAAHVNSLFANTVIYPMGQRKCSGGGCGATVEASVPLKKTFETNIAAINAAGSIAQVNHPNYKWSVQPEDLLGIPDYTLMEVWNGLPINNLGGTDDEGNTAPSTEALWDLLLSRGKIVWGVGSDDSHEMSGCAKSWIMVRAPELSAKALEAAIRKGDFYASNGVRLTDITVTPQQISIVINEKSKSRFVTRFIGQNGTVLAEVTGKKPTYSFKGNETYVRATVTDADGEKAWVQPVFLKKKP